MSVVNFYRSIYRLKKAGNFSLNEIYEMMPYEFEIFAMQLYEDLEKESKG